MSMTLPHDLPDDCRFFQSNSGNEHHWIITQPDRMRPYGKCWEVYGDELSKNSVVKAFLDGSSTEEEYCLHGTGRYRYTEYTREDALRILGVDHSHRLPEGF